MPKQKRRELLSALLIDDAFVKRAQAVRAHAAVHRFSLQDMLRILADPSRAAGNDPAFVAHAPIGWRFVWTEEQHPDPLGWVIHFSASCEIDGVHYITPVAPLFHVLVRAFNVSNKTHDLAQFYVQENAQHIVLKPKQTN